MTSRSCRLQPLVENAVRHGLAGKDGPGTITILAEDDDYEAVITRRGRRRRRGPRAGTTRARRRRVDGLVGLGNVDERLRSAFGDEYGLVVETAPGAGTKVTVRVPKFAAGVRGMTAAVTACAVLAVDDEPPGARRARVPARPRRARRRGATCGSATEALRLLRRRAVDVGLPRHRDAGPDGLELAQVLAAVPAAARRSSSSPPTTTTPSTPSTCTPSTTCSSRCARSGCARRSRRVVAARPRRRATRDEQVAGRARRGHPLRPPLRGPLRRGPGRLRPAAHRRPAATWSGCRSAPSRSAGRDAGFVRIHRSILVVAGPRRGGARSGRPVRRVVVDGVELPVSRRHTRELRDLLRRRP